MPRTEVARFILSDLQKAYDFMKDKTMATTRVNKDAARLLYSRVALFEGTWLKNFKGNGFRAERRRMAGSCEEIITRTTSLRQETSDKEIEYFLGRGCKGFGRSEPNLLQRFD